MENEKNLQAAERPGIVYPPDQSVTEKFPDKAKRFIGETFSLFASHTWQVLSIVLVTALLTTAVVAPLAQLGGVKSALTGQYSQSTDTVEEKSEEEEIAELYAGIETWEDYARFCLKYDSEVSYVKYYEDAGDGLGNTLEVYVASVDSLESFMLEVNIMAHGMKGINEDYLELPKIDGIFISFLDSTISLSAKRKPARGFCSVLSVEEDNPRYADIVKYYNEQFSDTDIG